MYWKTTYAQTTIDAGPSMIVSVSSHISGAQSYGPTSWLQCYLRHCRAHHNSLLISLSCSRAVLVLVWQQICFPHLILPPGLQHCLVCLHHQLDSFTNTACFPAARASDCMAISTCSLSSISWLAQLRSRVVHSSDITADQLPCVVAVHSCFAIFGSQQLPKILNFLTC